MAVLSILRRAFPPVQGLKKAWGLNGSLIHVRNEHGHGHHETMKITPSRWGWHQFKDFLHFYLLLGFIPLASLVFFVNIYVGPAQLAEIPEGYEPKRWEYYKHPISRWMAKWIYPSHQEEYERYLYVMYVTHEQREMCLLEKKINKLMRTRMDSTYPFQYQAPIMETMLKVREDYETEEREYSGIETAV